jgi:enamine deaminase RidA (YjgF/YER057c/UK114 family)
MKRTIFNPKTMPKPIGAYSHATIVEAKRFMFVAGQVAVDRKGQVVGPGDVKKQFNQVFDSLAAILKAAGASFHHVVQFTTYLVNSRDLPAFIAARGARFKKIYPQGDYPPNTLLIIDRLVKEDLMIEVEAIVALD